MGVGGSPWLAEALADVAGPVPAGEGAGDLLCRLVERCRALLTPDVALVLVHGSERLRVEVYGSEEVQAVSSAEASAGEGPGCDCLDVRRPVANVALDDGCPWPRLAPLARRAGYRRASALPMHLDGATVGYVAVWCRGDREITDREFALAGILIDVATRTLVGHWDLERAAQRADQLEHALRSRVPIEQAKGMIAQRLGVSVEDAFTLLRVYARDRNARVGELASEVLDGTLAVPILLARVRRDHPLPDPGSVPA